MKLAVLFVLAGCDWGDTGIDWTGTERAVEQICACNDKACLDALGVDANLNLTRSVWTSLEGEELRRAHAASVRAATCSVAIYARDQVAKVQGWRTEMCACTTADCARGVELAAAQWVQHYNNDNWHLAGLILEADVVAIEELERCHAHHVPPQLLPSVLAVNGGVLSWQLADATNRICRCTTNACAELIDHQFYELWTNGFGSAYGLQLIEASPGATLRYYECFRRLAHGAHEARIHR